MTSTLLTTRHLFVEKQIATDEVFCDHVHVNGQAWTQGPNLNVRIPSILITHGNLHTQQVDLGTGAKIHPILTEFGGFPVHTYLQFVHPGPGVGGTFDTPSNVATEETLGAQNGTVHLQHDQVTVETVEPLDLNPNNTDVIVKALDVDARGHITRIERVDLRRLYEGNQTDLNEIQDTFIRNTYPLYNDVRMEGAGQLFLDWYQNVTEDASGDSQSINLGRFTSIAIDALNGLTDEKLFRGVIATRSGYVVSIPFESPFVLAWNVRTGESQTNGEIGSARYAGGCLLPNDRVLLAPYDQGSSVQVYDPVLNTLTSGPSISGFWGAILHPSGHVVLAAGPGDDIVILDVQTLAVTHTIPVTETKPASFEAWFSGMVMDARGRIWMVPYDHSTADVLVWDVNQTNPTRIQGPVVQMNPVYRNAVSPTPVDQKRCIGGSLGYDGSVVFGSHNILPVARFVHIAANVDDPDIPNASVTRIPDSIDPGTIGTISNVTHGTFVFPDGRIGVVPYNSTEIQTIDPGAPQQGQSTISSVGTNTRLGGACLLEDGRVVFCPSGVDFPETNTNRLGFYVQPVRPPRDMVYHPFWNHA